MSSLQLRYQSDYESMVSYREHLITQLESINNQIKSLLKEARQEKIIIQNWVCYSMPLKIGKHKCEDFSSCVKYVKKDMPWVSDPEAYVGSIYNHEERKRKH